MRDVLSVPIEMRKRLAKLTSNILNPFLVSFVVIMLLSFESASSTSDALKWALISTALSVLPVFVVVVCLVCNKKLDGIFVNSRRQRFKVYLLASACAVAGCVVLAYFGAPLLLIAAFVAGLVSIITFMSINFLWKISLHTAFVTASVTILTIVYVSVVAGTLKISKQALESPALKQAFLERGATAWWSSPAEVSAYRASEEKRLGDIIRKAKITLD